MVIFFNESLWCGIFLLISWNVAALENHNLLNIFTMEAKMEQSYKSKQYMAIFSTLTQQRK